MDEISAPSKKALLLISYPRVFEALKAALEEIGCHTTDDFDAVSGADLVILDSFYLKAGMADFLKMENSDAMTLHVLLQNNEIPGFQGQAEGAENTEGALVLKHGQSPEELFLSAMEWLKNTWGVPLSKLLGKEFGGGLWVSLMGRLTALSGLREPIRTAV